MILHMTALLFFYYLILSISTGNATICSKVPSKVKYNLNYEYVYNNIIEVDTWVSNSSSKENVVKEYYKFKTFLYPTADNGYFEVWKVNLISENKTINDFFYEEENLSPKQIIIPYNQNFTQSLSDNKFDLNSESFIKCKQAFKTAESIKLDKLGAEKIISSLSIVPNTEQEPFESKLFDIFTMKKASNIIFKGKIEGEGKEESIKKYFLKNAILYEEKTSFNYEYQKGTGKERKTYTSRGNKYSFIDSIKEIKFEEFSVENGIDNFSNVRYFVDDNGLFIPVTLYPSKDTNAYIRPLSDKSFIYKQYFLNNYSGLNYFLLSPESLKISKTIIHSPKFFISEYKNINYKVPILVGNDILSSGFIYLNDRKRQFRFLANSEQSMPSDATLCRMKNKKLIFDVTVNNNNCSAVISLSNNRSLISENLVKALKLKTAKQGMSKDKPESIKEKVSIILSTPFEKGYKKIDAFINKEGSPDYDLVIGLDYLKGKEVQIDYNNTWIQIRPAK